LVFGECECHRPLHTSCNLLPPLPFPQVVGWSPPAECCETDAIELNNGFARGRHNHGSKCRSTLLFNAGGSEYKT